MCGIAGIIDTSCQTSRDTLEYYGRRMNALLRHRGPDDKGLWVDAQTGIVLAHRRLSILDLSPAGHQPMVSPCERYVLVFNGEIYNFRHLRKELDAISAWPWRGHSDTEVLLAGIRHWGLEQTLQKAVGMFALAVWDRQTHSLSLARDRLGEKPLYYGLIPQSSDFAGTCFVFASELKALRAIPGFPAEINRDVIPLYLRHRYIPTPYSIYAGIYKLWPGCILTFQGQRNIEPFPPTSSSPFLAKTRETVLRTTSGVISHVCQPIPYWSLGQAAYTGQQHPFSGTEAEAVDHVDRLLRQTVQGQMIADVPLGTFLSGGIDSSTIVALMQAQSTRPVQTFSIGFGDVSHNEAPYAKAVADYLKTQHTEYYVTEQDALNVIPRLPHIYDEPFADSSQIPTYLLSQLTRQAVTVSLSGDGGDEVFCGYWRYILGEQIWRRIQWLPTGIRNAISRAGLVLPVEWLNTGLSPVVPLFQKLDKVGRSIGDNIHKMARLIGSRNSLAFYQTAFSHWQQPLSIVRQPGTEELPYAFTRPDLLHPALLHNHILRQMTLLDTYTYLPDDILVKVDRAAMAVSLETRIPLLDHRIVEFALTLPVNMLYRERLGKRVLRTVLDRYVPRELVDRPKMGFGVPLARWLRGALRDWAEDLLDTSRLNREGFFRPEPIRHRWQEHLAGTYSRHYELWDILMFQAWLERQNSVSSTPLS